MHFKEYTVTGDNRLVQRTGVELTFTSMLSISTANMGEFQLKFIDFMISLIKPLDKEFYFYNEKFTNLCKHFEITRGGNNDKTIIQAIEDLGKSIVIIRTKDGDNVVHPWFSTIGYNEVTKIVKAKLNDDLAPYLLGLANKREYFQYEIGNILSLKKKSSILMYQWLHSHLHHKSINLSINKLRTNVLSMNEEKYPEVHDFIRYVINPVIKEINEKTDLIVEYKCNHRKNDKNPHPKITSIGFTISKKPAPEYRQIKLNIWNVSEQELVEGEKERNQVSAFLYHNKLAELANNNSLRDEIKVQAIAADAIAKNKNKEEKEKKVKKEKKVAPSRGAFPFSNY